MALPDIIIKAAREVVAELHERHHWPTKYEMLLEVLMRCPEKVTPITDLTPLFPRSNYSREQAVRNLINRLNKKLKPHGVQVKHVSAYQLIVDDDGGQDFT